MNQKHYYVNRKHPAVWLMVLSMAASAVAAILLPGGRTLTAPGIWFGIVLPAIAAVMYALITVCSGDEMLYRTVVPVWLAGISYAVQSGSWLSWLAAVLFCFCYTWVINGRAGRLWLLALNAATLGALVYMGMVTDVVVLPELLMVLGILLLLPAIRVHNDGKWHPRWGDRIEGRWVRSAQVMEQITAYFMPNRTGANNLFAESVEITELEQYIRRKRKEGLTGFGITHVVLAAYARTVAKYPALNRFIAGQRIYSRGEDIAVCMTVKKELTADAPDSLVKVHLNPADTATDVFHKFNAKVEEAKNEMATTADSTVAGFMMVPRLFLKFAIWLLKTLDYFGLVPRFLLEISPFHGSVYFTVLGSLGIQPVYHHLYDFGTVPAFCAFGKKRRAEEIQDGQIVERKYLDMKFNLDERICDGFYYSRVIKYFLKLLSHPEVLDQAPEVIERDIP